MASHVKFLPWVGKLYRRNEGARLLILGESHYGDAEEHDREVTRRLTKQYVRGDWSWRFWTNISQVISGKPHWQIDRAAVWDRIALYNYVQVLAASEARVAPTRSMFVGSEAAFLEVLARLRPTHVLVCGYRLWSNMPAFNGRAGSFSVRGNRYAWGEYATGRTAARTMAMHHPSSAFSASRWHPVVRRFLGGGVVVDRE